MTPKTTERLTITGPAGALEVVVNAPALDPPAAPRGIALIAHPNPLQGGTLDNKVVQTLARTFFALGYVGVRLNFRGVGASEGRFDDGVGETGDALAALAWAQARFGTTENAGGATGAPGLPPAGVTGAHRALPVVLAGFSFGTHVQTRVAGTIACERMVLLGPAVGRFGETAVPADTIVIHGEEDDIVPLAGVFAWARPQALPIIVFPGCGHFFHGRLPMLQRVITGMWQRGRADE